MVSAMLVVGLAGCGGEKQAATTTTTTPTGQMTSVRLYFLHGGKVQPVSRAVPVTKPVWLAAWKGLAAGPTGETPLAPSTALPLESSWTLGVTNDNVLSLSTVELSRAALAQVVYTLTQFATTRPVIVNGRRYTRADFEDETPAILVESPLPLQAVASPLRVTGTANTFEATFEYELVGPDGKVVASHFVTATSGSGTRGTFDFTVPYKVDRYGVGELVVYELSAKDGSRIHLVEIPIRMMR